MNLFLPLSRLLSAARMPGHVVAYDVHGEHLWIEFVATVKAYAAAYAAAPQQRWLLHDDSPLGFLQRFLGLAYAGKRIVIPGNNLSGTLAALASTFDANAADVWPEAQPMSFAQSSLDLLDAAVIEIYTSGSTGQPKKVSKCFKQLALEMATLESLWGENMGGAIVLSTVPHHHLYGLLFRLLWPLCAGRPFDVVTCTDPDVLKQRFSLLGCDRPCVLVSSPAQLSRLPHLADLQRWQRLPAMVFSSGGALDAVAAHELALQWGVVPVEVFGSTETGGVAWRCQTTSDLAWTPFPSVSVGVDGVDQAIVLISPFLENALPYRMADAGEMLPDGRFLLKGRLDRVVKIEEKRLLLPDMEGCLNEHPWVRTCAVVLLSGLRQQLGVVAVLTATGYAALLAQGRRIVVHALREHLKCCFESVLLPRRWRFVEALPLDERGKLPQTLLQNLFLVS